MVCLVALGFFFWKEDALPTLDASRTMRIDSSVLHDGFPLQLQQTCDGLGERPPLTVADIPEGAQSLAVVIEDPDAPTGAFVHWVAWNVPTNLPSIRGDEVPIGTVEGLNSAGTVGWFAPCPPAGEMHRYVFTVYALDSTLMLPAGASYEKFARDADRHILAKGTMTGTYQR